MHPLNVSSCQYKSSWWCSYDCGRGLHHAQMWENVPFLFLFIFVLFSPGLLHTEAVGQISIQSSPPLSRLVIWLRQTPSSLQTPMFSACMPETSHASCTPFSSWLTPDILRLLGSKQIFHFFQNPVYRSNTQQGSWRSHQGGRQPSHLPLWALVRANIGQRLNTLVLLTLTLPKTKLTFQGEQKHG